MKAWFNIYGVILKVESDHPLAFETISKELHPFRLGQNGRRNGTLQLKISTLHSLKGKKSSPLIFPYYDEFMTKRLTPQRGVVIRYAKTDILASSHPDKPLIEAAASFRRDIFPDPAFHYLFTQTVSPWFKQRGLFFLHASGVAEKGLGILIIGKPEAGKSVLSTSAVRGGFQFLSDEQPVLSLTHGKVIAHAFPRRIRLDRKVAALIPELHRLVKSSSSERLIFPMEMIRPHCSIASCWPRILVFPRFHLRGRLRITRLTPTQAFGELLQEDYFVWYRNSPWTRFCRKHLTLFEHLVRQTKAFALEYGNRDILGIPALFRKLLHDEE